MFTYSKILNLNTTQLAIFFIPLISISLAAQNFREPNLEYFESLPDSVKTEIISQGDNSLQINNKKQTEYLTNSFDLQNSLRQNAFQNLSDKELKEKKELNLIFGFNFFNEENNILELEDPILDIPLNADYMISVNDELEILLTGGVDKFLNTRVDMGGNILIPEIGSLSIANLSLAKASEKINEYVNLKYIGTETFISITRPSYRKISIIGSVENPGTYLVNPFTSVSGALKYAGGLTKNASIRNVQLINYKGDKVFVDLYDFLVFGDRSNDRNVLNGDTINILATDRFVDIKGAIHRPMKYEYKPEDSIEELIKIAQGMKSNASSEKIFVNKLINNNIISKKVGLKEIIGSEEIRELNIGGEEKSLSKELLVNGSAVTNGYYDFNDNDALSTIINQLSFSYNIYPYYAVIKQSSMGGLSNEILSFSIADPESYSNIKLKNNPEIYFYSVEEIKEISEKFVAISFPNEPEEIDEGMKNRRFMNDQRTRLRSLEGEDLEDIDELQKELEEYNILLSDLKIVSSGKKRMLLPLSGNFIPKTLINNLNVNSVHNIDGVSVTKQNGDLIANAYLQNVMSSEIIAVSFPTLENKLIKVEITGQVQSPGEYIVSNSTSLNSLYALAGGLNKNASASGIVFSRESIKEKEKIAFEGAKKILIDTYIQNLANPLSSQSGATGTSSEIAGILTLIDDVAFIGRISGDFSEDSLSANKLILENGDKLLVPSQSILVSIVGEVLNPSTVLHKPSLSYDDYIELAGGYSKFASPKDLYIVRESGESYQLNRGYFRREIFLNPGDTIVVPRDLEKISTIPLVSIATKIVSDIAFAAASLNSLSD